MEDTRELIEIIKDEVDSLRAENEYLRKMVDVLIKTQESLIDALKQSK